MTPQTQGEKVVQLQTRVEALEALVPRFLYLEDKVSTFIDRHEAKEEERERAQKERHLENTERLENISNTVARRTLWTSIAALVWTAAGVIATIAFGILAYRMATKSNLDIKQMFSHTPVLAEREK